MTDRDNLEFKASWIYLHDRMESQKRSVFFRKTFTATDSGRSINIRISADSRYKLYINGIYVASGPERGDRFRTYYDTLDIAPYLKKGKNAAAVHVLKFPWDPAAAIRFQTGPVWLQSTSRGGLLLDGGEDLPQINTDAQWHVMEDTSYVFSEAECSKYAGDQELVRGEKYPEAWTEPDFDDEHWSKACCICPATGWGLGGVLYNWQLVPRDIPLLAEKSVFPLKTISRSDKELEPEGGNEFHRNGGVFPPHAKSTVVIDMGRVVTAYVSLELQAGGGEAVEMMYAESYYQVDAGGNLYKDIRDDAGGVLAGEVDRYMARKGSQQYEPYFFRTFRFLKISVETGDTPVTMHPPQFRLTGYPLEVKAVFRAENPVMEQFWEISVRTIRRCIHETFEDCPYYEQMQYLMDTAIESLQVYHLSGDDRLTKRAVLDFLGAQRPDGLFPCNAPAGFSQIIPGFNFMFVDLIYQHYRYFGDKTLLETCLPSLSRMLNYFHDKRDPETGLVTHCGYWEFVDWVEEWRSDFGTPMKNGDAVNFIYNQMYAWALGRTAELYREIKLPDMARRCEERKAAIIRAVNRHAYDPKTGYYRSKPGDERFALHGQLWAVLGGCVTGEEATALMERAIRDPGLLKCSYSMSFYLFRAIEEADLYEKSVALWEDWERMLGKNITTWPEDIVTQRSDCHGWGAIPIYEFLSGCLGVRPLTPGWNGVEIRPSAHELGEMEGTLPIPSGLLHAAKKKLSDGRWQFILSLPVPMDIVFWNGRQKISRHAKEFVTEYRVESPDPETGH